MDDATAELLRTAQWRKATRSGEAGDCIEVAPLADGRIGLRDSEHPEQPAYVVSPSVWAAFIDGAKQGEFDF
ncbi:DUF397 domain-containing protein [Nonomuraea soli]|uniref:DUF397 domain-containing protein n=1 Tax=Nonomuraea soli TaxID=1032476 RepID=A0A7W0CUK4_9ACTN|nr:DUF397 domain-containing protein [Nonomuraea soli]MBA2897647.1 hypothetical protein [Nonomuraea soli]